MLKTCEFFARVERLGARRASLAASFPRPGAFFPFCFSAASRRLAARSLLRSLPPLRCASSGSILSSLARQADSRLPGVLHSCLRRLSRLRARSSASGWPIAHLFGTAGRTRGRSSPRRSPRHRSVVFGPRTCFPAADRITMPAELAPHCDARSFPIPSLRFAMTPADDAPVRRALSFVPRQLTAFDDDPIRLSVSSSILAPPAVAPTLSRAARGMWQAEGRAALESRAPSRRP